MVGMDIKKMFFDRKAVTGAVDRATRRVLSRFGAFVRRGAKSSIRKRKRISAPGQPPSSHTGMLKRMIYFGYEPGRQSVVIGPQRVNQKAGTAPEALEYGGHVRMTWGRNKGKRVAVAARPFMGPAFEKEKPKLPAMWANSVRS